MSCAAQKLRNFDLWDSVLAYQRVDDPRFFQLRSLSSSPVQTVDRRLGRLVLCVLVGWLLFFTLNREDFSFVIHLDRQPRTSRRREAQTGSRARSGSRSERTLDAVEHSRTLMEWWPFLIFHRGGLRIKVINNTGARPRFTSLPAVSEIQTVRLPRLRRLASYSRQFLTR